MGAITYNRGKLDEAERFYRQAITINPSYADSYNNLGVLLHDQGKDNEAIEAYQKAIALNPNFSHAYSNLANIFREQKKFKEAEELCKKAISLDPANWEALNNLGNILQEQERLEEAEPVYLKALEMDKKNLVLHGNVINTLANQGRWRDAVACAQHMAGIKPDNLLFRYRPLALAPIIPGSNAEIDEWRAWVTQELSHLPPVDLSQYMADIIFAESDPSFYLTYQGRDNHALKKEYARHFTQHYTSSDITIPKGRKPHIAFLVTDKHEGIFWQIMGGIINHWNTKLADVMILCTPPCKNFLAKHIKNPEVKLGVMKKDFKTMVDSIRALAFDLVHFWEVGSDSMNYFLPFFRIAPIQTTGWGSIETTGIPEVDYFISSTWQETANAQEHYSESLVLLDTLPAYFEKPQLKEKLYGREYFGFSETDTLYLVPQTLYKIHPDFDTVLGDILRKDPKGKLLLVHYTSPYPGQLLRARFSRTIPDVLERVTFLPRQDRRGYFSLLAMADVILDPLYFGGGLTAAEALAVGTPIVTLPSNYLRGRSTYACYMRMGLQGLAAKNTKDYVETALRLANDKTYRQEVNTSILEQHRVLYNNTAAVRAFETCFLNLIEHHRNAR